MRGEFLNPRPNGPDWMFYGFWSRSIADDRGWLSPLRRPDLVANYLKSIETSGLLGLDHKLEYLDNEPWIARPLYAEIDHVVMLNRANLLKQYVSFALMHHRLIDADGSVHGNTAPKPRRIRVRPADAIAHMRHREGLTKRYRDMAVAAGVPCHTVVYEDLLAERRESVLRDVQNFLGVRPAELKAELVKQNPQPLHDIVENYDELSEAVARSDYAYTLYLPT